MIVFIATLFFYWQTIEIPFRAKDDFQVELKYDLKQRPAREGQHISFEANKDKAGTLPYLVVHVKILNHKTDEIRFKCENNLGQSLFNRKADKSLAYQIDMGYIDDLKDHVSPYSYTVYAVSDKKDMLNKIELLVMEDGTFLVNGEKRGKF